VLTVHSYLQDVDVRDVPRRGKRLDSLYKHKKAVSVLQRSTACWNAE
jgi:hypothetical protein